MNLIDEYRHLLNGSDVNESALQTFLEDHTQLIPLPYLDNHHLHMNTVITKFPLGTEFITDFAYLTKSSDYWHLVLIELENCNKQIFKEDNHNIRFTSAFNAAYDQILSWRAYIEEHKDQVLESIKKIRVPLAHNDVGFKYVLVIGRSSEKENSEKRRKMFAQKSRDDIIVMTYDSIISHYQTYPYLPESKLLLSPWGEKGYTVKKVTDNLSTPIFAYIYPEYLRFSRPEDVEVLKKQGYDMDGWMNGKLLQFNDKYTTCDQVLKCRSH